MKKKHIIQIMKLFILFLILGGKLSYAGLTYAQTTRISLRLNNRPVKEVFQEIEKQSEYVIFYYDGVLDVNRRVTLDEKNSTVDKILDLVFEGADNAYKIIDRQIFITRGEKQPDAQPQQQPERKLITGTVTDAVGEPLAGANIVEIGTANGALTDIDGHFSIEVRKTGAMLRFSYVGYVTQEVAAPARPPLIVKLEESAVQTDEIVVVAYGTQKKETLTGAVSSVSSKDLKVSSSASIANALAGRISGLTSTQESGQPGMDDANLYLRGIGTINGSNPLILIDGVPRDNIRTLDANEVETISVLKDASATAVFGVRGANGVILITTKRGKQGKPVVSLKATYGLTPSWATDNYERADEQAQLNMLYMVYHDYYREGVGNTIERASERAIAALNSKFNRFGYQVSVAGPGLYENVIVEEYDNSGRVPGEYYNWEDALFRTAAYQTYDFAVSGGSANTNYYSSLSYTKDQGRIIVNDFDRFSGRINLTQKAGKFLEFTTNINASRTDKSGYNDTRTQANNLFMQTRFCLWGVYYPWDYKTMEPWTAVYQSNAYNQMYYKDEWENSSINNRLMASETLTLHLLPGLDLRSVFSYDNTTAKDHIYYSANHYSGTSTSGSVNEMTTIYEKTVSSTTATYNASFGQNTIGILAGFEAEKNTTDFARATGTGLPSSTLHTVSTAGTLSAAGYNWGNAMVSILSKVDYNFAEKYFASASYRRDGSSKLAPEKRWGDFWSVAGAWKIANEEFLHNSELISDLRVRASYGINGTLPSNNYGYMNLMSYTSKYMGSPGGAISTKANEDLSWETSYTTNLGLDFGLFDNRLRGTVEYFNRDSKNLLQDVNISTVTGFSTILQNIGEINNKGVEIELSGDIYRNKDLTWSASLNAAFIKSKVTKLYEGTDKTWYDPTGGDARAWYIYREGESTLAFWGLEWAGVYNDGTGKLVNEDGSNTDNGRNVWYVNDPDDPTKGDFLFNGRGATFTAGDANNKVLGDAMPDVSGGFATNVSYKGIDLGLNFLYKIGGYLYDGAYKDVADDGYFWNNMRAASYYKNMWSELNPNGTLPRISGMDWWDAREYSSRQMHDASFLRLKNISVGYSLPKNIVSKALLSNARLFFNASNLLTFSKYKEADPEVNQYGTRGWETPYGKTYVFGIEVQF